MAPNQVVLVDLGQVFHDAAQPLLDPQLWQKLPDPLIALVISKLPLLKLIRAIPSCGRTIRREVMTNPRKPLLSVHSKIYNRESFFPTFCEGKKSRRMWAFNLESEHSTPLPDLNFLPHDATSILAGTGGLLCVSTGGGCNRRPQCQARSDDGSGRIVASKDDDWWSDSLKLLPQPVFFICNPLTRKFRRLPLMNAPLSFAVAHLEVRDSGDYELYIVGWVEANEEMVVAAYSSGCHAWTYWRALANALRPAPPPPTTTRTTLFEPGSNTCAVVGHRIWLAGEIKWAGIWDSRILCFDLDSSCWKYVLNWLTGFEAPRVVRCTAEDDDDRVFIASQLTRYPFTVYILQVTAVGSSDRDSSASMTSKQRNNCFREIAQMPHDLQLLFFTDNVSSSSANRTSAFKLAWECRSGNGCICFYNPSNGCLAWFCLKAQIWRTLPQQWGFTQSKALQSFESPYTSMSNCVWNPSFIALV
ncbi:unnamed protein product [Sphagnum balticum]